MVLFCTSFWHLIDIWAIYARVVSVNPEGSTSFRSALLPRLFLCRTGFPDHWSCWWKQSGIIMDSMAEVTSLIASFAWFRLPHRISQKWLSCLFSPNFARIELDWYCLRQSFTSWFYPAREWPFLLPHHFQIFHRKLHHNLLLPS